MSRPLPVMEIRQMLGRAGRPKYDDYGEAWILCKGTDGWEVADLVSEKYFFGVSNQSSLNYLESQLLRTHILSIISTGGINHRGEIGDFLESTFLGYSTPKHILTEKIDDTLNWLLEERFIRKLGVDDDYLAKRADSKFDEYDDWDDNVPIWASTAKDIPGVEISDTNQTVKMPRKSAFTKPTFGFSVATNLE